VHSLLLLCWLLAKKTRRRKRSELERKVGRVIKKAALRLALEDFVKFTKSLALELLLPLLAQRHNNTCPHVAIWLSI